MSAIATPEVDVDSRVLEQLDFVLVCSVRVAAIVQLGKWTLLRGAPSAPCGNEAVANARCKGCGRASFICADHRAFVLSQPLVVCPHCMAQGAAIVVYEFTPLAGA